MQPRDAAETRAALRALVACPTGSIGTADKRGIAEAVGDFPFPIAPGVSYCGFNSRKSFGGNSYFVEHPGGNWLIDAPRFVEHLARRLAEKGGIRYIFLTHRDDVADAALYAARFGATRIIHRLELAAQPDAERVIDGFEPVELAPGFLAIPTPGHTRGHTALLHANEFLFSGDHIWWSRARGRLNASRDVCWYSWRRQVESVALLERYSFEWVLPGHGERAHFDARGDAAGDGAVGGGSGGMTPMRAAIGVPVRRGDRQSAWVPSRATRGAPAFQPGPSAPFTRISL